MKIEIRQPVKFGLNEVIIANLLSVAPSFLVGVLIPFGVVPLIFYLLLFVTKSTLTNFPFSLEFSVICLLAGFFIFFFYPLLLGVNYYIKLIVGRIMSPPEGAHVCQISMTPKLCCGLRAFLEDADDIGYLTISSDCIEFRGDSIEFSIPKAEISNFRNYNIGWRGCWIIGKRIKFTISGHDKFKEIEVCERHTCTIPNSRFLSDQIYAQISTLSGQNPDKIPNISDFSPK
ncbi:MAG: hypothetical protein WCS96_07145 [Victivallales bacterium]